MRSEITIVIPPELEHDSAYITQALCRELHKRQIAAQPESCSAQLLKKSIDARHGRVKLVMRYAVSLGKDDPAEKWTAPDWHTAGSKTVLIIGSGPAGLFGALSLLEHGIKPVIIERGSEVSRRKRDIAAISTQGIVGTHSNYCFGQGGAGTFSDGKLYTRSTKRGDSSAILNLFAYFGADHSICTDAHPHIGTNRLPAIVQEICKKIESLGGELHFDTYCTDFVLAQKNGEKTVKGIRATNTRTGRAEDFFADAVLLASGHSAYDIYTLIARHAPGALEAKTFAVGVRVEHPRTLIDSIQYHGAQNARSLGAAEYRFTSQQNGRGVYSFCMCPGGFVVPSATGPNQLVVNGMSSAGRNSRWSNAAVVVETRPEDIPQQFLEQAESQGCSAFAGLLWREHMEHLAAQHGSGQRAPAQRLADFLSHAESGSLPVTSYAPGIVSSRLDKWLPAQISERLGSCFLEVNRKMKGYISPDALLIAGETRTSTPVRIMRNAETLECTALKNLYPAGEGSGYAGGIVSSAMDGEKCARRIAQKLETSHD